MVSINTFQYEILPAITTICCQTKINIKARHFQTCNLSVRKKGCQRSLNKKAPLKNLLKLQPFHI